MKAKKVLTAVLSAAMVFSVLPVTSAKAEEIDGSTIFVDQEVIDVTLPTTASQKFYVDPQGLIAIGKADDPSTASAANAGTVVGTSDMYAVNRSSIPLALSVSYKLVDSAASGGVTVVDAVADDDAAQAIKDDATKKIAVSVSAAGATQDATSGANAYTGKVFIASSGTADMTGTAMANADVVYAKTGATPATADYFMTAETYKAQLKDGKTTADAYDSSAYEYVVDATAKKASCVKLTIGGYCSTKADWSDYADGTETLKLDVVFEFKKLTTTAGDYSDATVGADVQVGPKVTVDTNGLITISGLTAARNYKSIAISNGDAAGTINSTNATWGNQAWSSTEGGELTCQLTASKWASWYTGKTVTVTVTLSDNTTITGSVVMP